MKDSQQASRKLERVWVGGGYNVLQYRKWSRQMKKGQTQGRKSLPCERRSLQIDKQAKKELKSVRRKIDLRMIQCASASTRTGTVGPEKFNCSIMPPFNFSERQRLHNSETAERLNLQALDTSKQRTRTRLQRTNPR